ncbi:hypothetical protein PM10SUCC1_28910 [Propionigenium maris DSM 9537]|uniref:Uncharacterized protein n=1 Tax=Propionigenium maris DSM 9537 TaxID=1123000 RepID=A0A9W6LPA3_9FUSO|nr:hypothetical protein [Propionigenium maris]GLI57377.1 hypothetical protein PM10SUCC1_28910 [Propionigenium maris DSM 9537]
MRHDITKWMIHFTSDFFNEDDYGELYGYGDAYDVLKTILRINGLKPSYSLRNGKTTLFGGEPVICATEMPIYSLIEYVKSRNDSTMVGGYGVAFLKKEFFEMGARPVIYGLSKEKLKYKKNGKYIRLLEEKDLSLTEQYRYVPFNLSSNKWIDWSHEREWRWKESNLFEDITQKGSHGCYEHFNGIPIFSDEEKSFSEIGVLVWTREEAKEIQKELTSYYIAEENNYETPFSKDVLANSFIIILEEIEKAVKENRIIDFQTIDGLKAEQLINPLIIHDDTECHYEIIKQAIENAEIAGEKAAIKDNIDNPIDEGPCGSARIISYEIDNPIIQEMIKKGYASGPYDNWVWINLDIKSFQQSLNHSFEAFAPALEILNEELADIFELDHWLD